MSRVLDIKNLSFGYQKSRPLYKEFNLSVDKGEVVSIVGESGSGKSTLFSLIMGDLKPWSGEIRAQRASLIFQDPYSSFHPSYDIIDQIAEVASLDDLHKYLDRLNLESDLLHKKPHRLSGGQLQRCSILRSLLQKPKLLLADEPTSALDNVVALEVMKILVSLLDEVGIVLITHDEDLAKWASDRIIRLDERSSLQV